MIFYCDGKGGRGGGRRQVMVTVGGVQKGDSLALQAFGKKKDQQSALTLIIVVESFYA